MSKKDGEYSAAALIRDMPISVTGARTGEYITGHRTGAENGTIYVNDLIPPSKTRIDTIMNSDQKLIDQFFDNIKKIPFFSKLSNKQILDWLKNPSDKSKYVKPPDLVKSIGDYNENITFIDLPSKITNIFNNEDIRQSLLENTIKYKELVELILKHNGTNVLTFSPEYWHIHRLPPIITFSQFKSITKTKLTINLLDYDYQLLDNDHLLNIDFDDNLQVGIYMGKSIEPYSDLDSNLDKLLTPNDLMILDPVILNGFKKITLSGLKSMLQKIIRFRPLLVSFINYEPSNIVSGKYFLLLVFKLMLIHPGSLNPNTHYFNTGLESLLKRLAVISVEDTHPDRIDDTLSLMWGSYLARIIKGWKPPIQLIEHWVQIAFKLYSNPDYLIFNTDRAKSVILPNLNQHSPPFEQCANLLTSNYLGSMPGDLLMFIDLIKNYQIKKGNIEQPEIMQISHCIDQHWTPSLVYTCNPDVVKKYQSTNKSKPFSAFFNFVFSRLTGLNPRKTTLQKINDIAKLDDVVKIKFGQKRLWNILTELNFKPIKYTAIDNIHNLDYQLHDSWISGLIGEIKTTHNDIVSCIRIDDLTEPVPIKKLTPSTFRSNAATIAEKMEIPSELEESIINETKLKLASGLKLLPSIIPSSKFNNLKAKYVAEQNQYVLFDDDNEFSWNEIKNINTVYQSHDIDVKNNYFEAYRINFKTIAYNHLELLNKCLNGYQISELQYILRYVDTFDTFIELPKIKRDGSGDTESVDIKIIDTNWFLLQLATIYSGIICLVGLAKFKIKHLPSFRWIVIQIKNYIFKQKIEQSDKWIDQLEDTMIIQGIPRQAMTHQLECLNQMIKTHNNGIKGHFIWIPTGMGKTYITLSYLRYLKYNDSLPNYILYTLPSTAIGTVIDEMLNFGVKVNVLDRTKTHTIIKNLVKTKPSLAKNKLFLTIRNLVTGEPYCTMLPYCINLIEHDHVRECPDQLRENAHNCVFIIDEIHKTIKSGDKETLRSHHIMILAKLSYQFIGMTGTAIVNNDMYQLMPWMKLVIPYTINKFNYLTSLSTMIARKFNTGHIVHINEIEVDESELDTELLIQYKKLVPIELGGTNDRFIRTNLQRAINLCYHMIDSIMISKCMSLVKNGTYVMLVAINYQHQIRLAKYLIEQGLNPKDLFILANNIPISDLDTVVDYGFTLNLTPKNVADHNIHGYKIVIVTINKCEGYSLNYLTAAIQAPYPSNQAKRDQLMGRINRIEMKPKNIYYYTFHSLILTHMLKKHNNVKRLEDFFNQLAMEITTPIQHQSNDDDIFDRLISNQTPDTDTWKQIYYSCLNNT